METPVQVEKEAASRLDGLTPHQLVAEIRQISEQYEQEVPGGRRRWPESIRSRVLALGRLGVSPSKIAGLTGISRATVFLWCRNLSGGRVRRSARSSFVQLPVSPTVEQTSLSPTVRLSTPVTPRDEHRVAMIAPDGFRFEFSGEGAWGLAREAYADLKRGRA
jgi:hypothetical protein